MGLPAAKQGDRIVAGDTHIVMVPSTSGTVPTPLLHPFNGTLSGNLSGNVKIMGMPAATRGSTADNTPPHLPTPPGTAFQRQPANKGTVKLGSKTVNINGKPAARAGDPADTCNDPTDQPVGKVVATGTVFIGG